MSFSYTKQKPDIHTAHFKNGSYARVTMLREAFLPVNSPYITNLSFNHHICYLFAVDSVVCGVWRNPAS